MSSHHFATGPAKIIIKDFLGALQYDLNNHKLFIEKISLEYERYFKLYHFIYILRVIIFFVPCNK